MKSRAQAIPIQDDPSQDPMYGVALLKIALELKKQRGRSFDEIVDGVVSAMGFEPRAFRRYVAQNTGLLVTAARAKGY